MWGMGKEGDSRQSSCGTAVRKGKSRGAYVL